MALPLWLPGPAGFQEPDPVPGKGMNVNSSPASVGRHLCARPGSQVGEQLASEGKVLTTCYPTPQPYHTHTPHTPQHAHTHTTPYTHHITHTPRTHSPYTPHHTHTMYTLTTHTHHTTHNTHNIHTTHTTYTLTTHYTPHTHTRLFLSPRQSMPGSCVTAAAERLEATRWR